MEWVGGQGGGWLATRQFNVNAKVIKIDNKLKDWESWVLDGSEGQRNRTGQNG